MVRAQLETQTGALNQRMDDIEKSNNEKFAAGERRMDTLVTRADFLVFQALFVDPKTGLSKLADKEDVARLNNIVQNFTLAAQILQTGGRWIYRAIIAVAVILGAFSLIMGGFKGAGGFLIDWFKPTP